MLKNSLQSGITNPAIRMGQTITTVGVVVDSDGANNTCTVRYIDKEGRKQQKENVDVRLYDNGTGWFPSEGETVILEDTSDACVVIARYVGNYNMDVRSKMELKQDVYSDEGGGQDPGGSIV